MATLWEPPPEAAEIMLRTAQWVARLYGLRIKVEIDNGRGDHEAMLIDRLQAPPSGIFHG